LMVHSGMLKTHFCKASQQYTFPQLIEQDPSSVLCPGSSRLQLLTDQYQHLCLLPSITCLDVDNPIANSAHTTLAGAVGREGEWFSDCGNTSISLMSDRLGHADDAVATRLQAARTHSPWCLMESRS
jgi:hypothetical protein